MYSDTDTSDIDQAKRPAQPGSALRVFLVEDSGMVRDLIVSELGGVPGIVWAGFSDSENDALDKLARHPCDVLIVDIELRQGNGMSLLRRLAAQSSARSAASAASAASATSAASASSAPACAEGTDRSCKIVFTNNVCDSYRRAGDQVGVRHFLDKSFDLPRLRELIEHMSSGPVAASPRPPVPPPSGHT